jgi:hypothetical protein
MQWVEDKVLVHHDEQASVCRGVKERRIKGKERVG